MDLVNQAAKLAQEFFAFVGHLIVLIWDWTFGQFFRMFQMPFVTLPLWKQVLYVLVVMAIAYILYRVGMKILETILRIFRAIVEFFVSMIEGSRDVLFVGIGALVVAWIISNVGPVALLDNLHP
jgi:hypothetical protein